MEEFKVGDKVKVVETGYGVHPADMGKVTTILAVAKKGQKLCGFDGYTCEVDATGFTYDGYLNTDSTYANPRSFELVEAAPVPVSTTASNDLKFSMTQSGDLFKLEVAGAKLTYEQLTKILEVVYGS